VSPGAYQASRRQEAREKGYCNQCCARPQLDNDTRCLVCRNRQRIRDSLRAKKYPRATPDPMCECGNAKPKKAPCCDRCHELDSARLKAEDIRARIVRTLRHFDWIDGSELRAVMDIECDSPESSNLNARLYYMTKEGSVEARKTKGLGTQYRLKQQRRAA
jgi:hypothetical protein